jgi:hypothetical protein
MTGAPMEPLLSQPSMLDGVSLTYAWSRCPIEENSARDELPGLRGCGKEPTWQLSSSGQVGGIAVWAQPWAYKTSGLAIAAGPDVSHDVSS